MNQYRLVAIREPCNNHDPNAVAVVAKVKTEDFVLNLKLVFLSRSIASDVSKIIDADGALKILHSDITGLRRPKGNLGLNLSYIVINGHTSLNQ